MMSVIDCPLTTLTKVSHPSSTTVPARCRGPAAEHTPELSAETDRRPDDDAQPLCELNHGPPDADGLAEAWTQPIQQRVERDVCLGVLERPWDVMDLGAVEMPSTTRVQAVPLGEPPRQRSGCGGRPGTDGPILDGQPARGRVTIATLTGVAGAVRRAPERELRVVGREEVQGPRRRPRPPASPASAGEPHPGG